MDFTVLEVAVIVMGESVETLVYVLWWEILNLKDTKVACVYD
jgi:hypothetical protein